MWGRDTMLLRLELLDARERRAQHLTPLQLPTTFHLSHPALEIRPTNKATIVRRLTTRKGTMQQSVAGFLVMCKPLVEG